MARKTSLTAATAMTFAMYAMMSKRAQVWIERKSCSEVSSLLATTCLIVGMICNCQEACGVSKQFCEDEFKKCMHRMCETTFSHNSKCKEAADTYFFGVSMFGGGAFEMSQVGDIAFSFNSRFFELFFVNPMHFQSGCFISLSSLFQSCL
jgi:hypothetical protein